jgi:hypothetical protein
MTNVWIEHFNKINGIGVKDTTNDFEKLKQFCTTMLLNPSDTNDKLQLISIIIQLKTSIAIMSKLNELKDETTRL